MLLDDLYLAAPERSLRVVPVDGYRTTFEGSAGHGRMCRSKYITVHHW